MVSTDPPSTDDQRQLEYAAECTATVLRANEELILAEWERAACGAPHEWGMACTDDDEGTRAVVLLIEEELLPSNWHLVMSPENLALDAMHYEEWMTRHGYGVEIPDVPPEHLRNFTWWAAIHPIVPLRRMRLGAGGVPILVLFVNAV